MKNGTHVILKRHHQGRGEQKSHRILIRGITGWRSGRRDRDVIDTLPIGVIE